MADYDELHMHVSKTDLVPTNIQKKLFPLKSIAKQKTGTENRMNSNKKEQKRRTSNTPILLHSFILHFFFLWYLAYVYHTMTMPNKSA